MKLMAQMQRCLVGKTLPKVGVLDDFEMMQEGTMKDLIEDIKTQHKKVWEAYHGENRNTIEEISAMIEKVGGKIRELRENAPDDKNEKKKHFTKHAMIKHEELEKIVNHLKTERTTYVTATLRVQNRHGEQRTPDFVNKTFPHFKIPTFMNEDHDYDIRNMMSWLRNTKRKAFRIYYDHIVLNTLEASKMDKGIHHGRIARLSHMQAYVDHFNKAQHAIIELRRMRHPKGLLKHKKPKKARRNHEHKKTQHVDPKKMYGGSRLTAFPDLDDYGF